MSEFAERLEKFVRITVAGAALMGAVACSGDKSDPNQSEGRGTSTPAGADSEAPPLDPNDYEDVMASISRESLNEYHQDFTENQLANVALGACLGSQAEPEADITVTVNPGWKRKVREDGVDFTAYYHLIDSETTDGLDIQEQEGQINPPGIKESISTNYDQLIVQLPGAPAIEDTFSKLPIVITPQAIVPEQGLPVFFGTYRGVDYPVLYSGSYTGALEPGRLLAECVKLLETVPEVSAGDTEEVPVETETS